jgi:Acetoacetate decarboxylase (ADC)
MAEQQPETMGSVGRYPAPWSLKGRGYMLLYRFPGDFVVEKGLIPAFLEGSFVGGLGAVMLVDYTESNAGPYGELLFIPGKFRHGGKKLGCITRIYVSTAASVVNGWENWAIPKEQADFRFAAPERNSKGTVVVTKNGEPVLNVTLLHGRIAFPMHTRLMPFPLVQEKDGKLYYTTFTGRGMACRARIEEMRVNPELFPDVGRHRPLMSLRIDKFTLTFPPARVANRSR